MKPLLKFYDYLFYCTYHFLNKIRKREASEDVTWTFSLFTTCLLFILILETMGILFSKNMFQWRPPGSFYVIIIFVLVPLSIYLNDHWFLTNERYHTILEEYGEEPRGKDIIVGFFTFLIAVGVVLIWAGVKVLLWEAQRR